jgi:hypothetical protein
MPGTGFARATSGPKAFEGHIGEKKTGSFGALWETWGLCGPLRGPLMTM